MSFAEVLDNLSALSFPERQFLIQRALEMDDLELTDGELALVEKRLEDRRRNPESALSLEEAKQRLRPASLNEMARENPPGSGVLRHSISYYSHVYRRRTFQSHIA